MPVTNRVPRAAWIAGAVRLLIAAALAAPVLVWLGSRRWPLFVGAFVLALLLLGALERRWEARPLPRRSRPADRRRFRVFTGGKGKGKGNGHAHDVPEEGDEDAGDKPRWLM
jgi:membrane protein implicated in regulation of membrane protease activity